MYNTIIYSSSLHTYIIHTHISIDVRVVSATTLTLSLSLSLIHPQKKNFKKYPRKISRPKIYKKNLEKKNKSKIIK